VFAEPLCDFAK